MGKVPSVGYPTTAILLAIIVSITVLGYAERVDPAAVTSIYTAIVGGVLVGHYVKTSNGRHAETTTTTAPSGATTTTTAPAGTHHAEKGEL